MQGPIEIVEMKCAQVKGTGKDAEFVRRLVRGDAAAFEALYDTYSPLIFGQLLEMTGDRQTAEELLVETFFRAWDRAASFNGTKAGLPRWLLGIARDVAGSADCRRGGRPMIAVA